MIKNKRTAWVLLASISVNVLLTVLRKQQFNLAAIIGGTLALMFAPYLLALLIKGTCQLFKIRFEERSFIITYAAGWTFLALANILS